MPGIEVLSTTEVLYLHAQRAAAVVSGDGDGMRLKMHRIAMSADGNRMEVTSSSTFAEPTGWASGLGFCGHPHIKKLAVGDEAGRVVVLYNQNDTSSGLTADRNGFYNIYMKYSDDDGETWSAAAKVIDCATSFPADNALIVALGSNGDFIEVPSGTYEGRLIVPIWYTGVAASDHAVIYSDDSGATWTVAGQHLLGNNRSENTLAWCPNNVLVETTREDGTAEIERELFHITMSSTTTFTPSDQGEIADFKAINCNASSLQIDPTGSGYGTILWSGPTGGTSQTHRHTYRLRRSTDGGVTWADEYTPFPNNRYIGYNSIRMLNATEMLLAYETFTSNNFNDNSYVRMRIINLNTAFPE